MLSRKYFLFLWSNFRYWEIISYFYGVVLDTGKSFLFFLEVFPGYREIISYFY